MARWTRCIDHNLKLGTLSACYRYDLLCRVWHSKMSCPRRPRAEWLKSLSATAWAGKTISRSGTWLIIAELPLQKSYSISLVYWSLSFLLHFRPCVLYLYIDLGSRPRPHMYPIRPTLYSNFHMSLILPIVCSTCGVKPCEMMAEWCQRRVILLITAKQDVLHRISQQRSSKRFAARC